MGITFKRTDERLQGALTLGLTLFGVVTERGTRFGWGIIVTVHHSSPRPLASCAFANITCPLSLYLSLFLFSLSPYSCVCHCYRPALQKNSANLRRKAKKDTPHRDLRPPRLLTLCLSTLQNPTLQPKHQMVPPYLFHHRHSSPPFSQILLPLFPDLGLATGVVYSDS